MIEKALRYLVGLKDNKTYVIDGITYSDNDLVRVTERKRYPERKTVNSLDAIAKLISAEYATIGEQAGEANPLFIRVIDPKTVEVFTRPDQFQKRTYAYQAECVDADFREGWRDQQAAIIEIKSRFIPTEDSEYLLGLISRMKKEEGVRSDDNGVSQTITAKSGVSLVAVEGVKPRLNLRPFRTFREVEQPDSEFILRLDDNGRVGLFEADGGIWRMEAKDNIAAYFETRLHDMVADGRLVVMI